jgi:hypothetical protein
MIYTRFPNASEGHQDGATGAVRLENNGGEEVGVETKDGI